MNARTLPGPALCACLAAAGSLHGLRVSGGTFVARNGIVQGWGGDGVSAVTSASGSYQDIIAVANAGTGFRLGYESYSGTLVGCTADNNGGNGFQLYSANATGCVSQSNLIGVVASSASVRACTVVSNAASSIQCDGNCLIAETNVRFNARTDSLVPATNFSFAASNTTGPIVTAVGNIATSSPWANFAF